MSFLTRKLVLPFRDSERIVEAADFDRVIHVTRVSDYLGLGFGEFTLEWNSNGDYAQFNPVHDGLHWPFVLPAEVELWGAHSREDENGNPEIVSVSLIVTKPG